MKNAQTKRVAKAAVILLLVTLGVSLLAWWNPLEKQQLYLSNFLYYERPTKNQVVVVSIDDQTVSENGLGKFSSWCRTYYVPVLERLAEYKPAVIGVDIFFTNKSKGLCQDDVNKILSSDNPIDAIAKYDSKFSNPDDLELGKKIMDLKQVVLLADGTVNASEERDYSYLPANFSFPIAELINSDSLIAHARLMKDSTGLIRNILPALGNSDQQRLLALPVLTALYSKGVYPIDSIDWSSDQLLIRSNGNDFRIPLQNFQLLINYTEKARNLFDPRQENAPVRIISFWDLYNKNDKDWSFLKDKIVLVGSGFLNSGDNYFTPLDTTAFQPGVMIHAQAIQTILDQAWLRNQTLMEQIATIAMMTAGALAVVLILHIGWAIPLLLLLILAYTMAAAPVLFRTQGLILNMVYPPLAIVATAVVGYAYRYLVEFRQKNRIVGALGQYVNSEVAARVLDSDESRVTTGGEKRQITVIFTDIRGFTSISETLQPQSLVTLLNEYFEVMAGVIARNGGVVDKYEGDALMAFFEDRFAEVPGNNGKLGEAAGHSSAVSAGLGNGIPISLSGAERAARAALEMRLELPKLNAKWKTDPPLPGGEKKPEIDFRVGVSTGEAVVGNIGSSQHIQYTVIGDIVNLGSRLESANKKYQTHVMLAEATFEQIKNKYECRFLDMIKVKGKDHPVKTYELLAPAGQLSPDQRELIQAYNKALVLYFERKFVEALDVFQNEVFKRWPADYLSNLYAGRCELLKRFPPKPDWDFVYKMESK